MLSYEPKVKVVNRKFFFYDLIRLANRKGNYLQLKRFDKKAYHSNDSKFYFEQIYLKEKKKKILKIFLKNAEKLILCL